MEARRIAIPLLVCFGLTALVACDRPTFDAATPEGKRAIIELTNKHLSAGNCAAAITEIEGLYKSASTDNEVRMIAASAYACKANINFFKLVGQLVENSAFMGGNGFWALLAKLFPSTLDPNDRVVEGALLATDALLANIKAGAVILPGNYINEGTYNPGAKVASDRLDNANIYMLFVNMATLGSLENRYGVPDPTTHLPTQALPWTTADHPNMPTQGCAFASSLILLVDNLDVVVANLKGNLKEGLTTLKASLQSSIYTACDTICDAKGDDCPYCPIALRDRSQCTGELNDIPSEVAAALTSLVNTGWTVPVP